MRIDDDDVPPTEVVAWLFAAVAAGPSHPGEVSPAERLRPALLAASASDREAALLHLVRGLETASDGQRVHLLYSLQGFAGDALVEAFVHLVEPAPAPWLGHTDPVGGQRLASVFFAVLAHGPGTTDGRLILGLRDLARRYDLHAQALPHFVTFHAADHGVDVLTAFIDGGGVLEPGLARRFGARFARDAAPQIVAAGRLLQGHPHHTREQFFEGAASRLREADRLGLSQALGLTSAPRP